MFLQYAKETLARTEQKKVMYPSQISCLAGNCSFSISWKGEMRPCVTFDEPAVPVFEKGFEAAWQELSRKAKTFQVCEDCVRCSLRPVCQICPAVAFLETGQYDGLPEYLCRYSKEKVRLLKEFVDVKEGSRH